MAQMLTGDIARHAQKMGGLDKTYNMSVDNCDDELQWMKQVRHYQQVYPSFCTPNTVITLNPGHGVSTKDA